VIEVVELQPGPHQRRKKKKGGRGDEISKEQREAVVTNQSHNKDSDKSYKRKNGVAKRVTSNR
jgi:hypothetical protein